MRHALMMRPVAAAFLLTLTAAHTGASGAECKGNPNAIGTSRTVAVDPAEYARIGTMQYPDTLPLNDREVVLTFDDGPIPPNTKKVLDILASQCVKATFFLVGQMATAYPSFVRREFDEGHTIATHSQTHAPRIWKWPIPNQEADFDAGFDSVRKALGDPNAVAPFFRFPGLGKSAQLEAHFASQGVMIWSADFPADDWLRIGSKQVAARAINRLEKKGKGVLLLHDIHAVTVAALPIILSELKKRNFSIVHVVPGGANRPKTAGDPQPLSLQPPLPSQFTR